MPLSIASITSSDKGKLFFIGLGFWSVHGECIHWAILHWIHIILVQVDSLTKMTRSYFLQDDPLQWLDGLCACPLCRSIAARLHIRINWTTFRLLNNVKVEAGKATYNEFSSFWQWIRGKMRLYAQSQCGKNGVQSVIKIILGIQQEE